MHPPREPSGASGPPKPPRRPRYPGNHPRRFAERYKELDSSRWPAIQDHVRAQGRTPAGSHVPVLTAEVLQHLAPAPHDVIVDATLGGGGHAAQILGRLEWPGRLIGLDRDPNALERASARLGTSDRRAILRLGRFSTLQELLKNEGLDGCDGLLADLGVSSLQIDDPTRGFSFKQDGPLDLRMDPREGQPASELLKVLPVRELATALKDLADEPEHDAIAYAIARQLKRAPIRTTLELAAIILHAKGIDPISWKQRAREEPGALHPAALTFQALRILVNDELGELAKLLEAAPECLRPGGRLVIISFHRGEDRLVKQSLRAGLASGQYDSIAGDPVRPEQEEIRANPRSASAKLRWARKPGAG